MNRLCTAALFTAACASAKDPTPTPYVYPFGSFTAEARASALSLCPAGPPKVETTPMPDNAARLRAPVDVVTEYCEGPNPQRVALHTEWDRGTNRIFWMSLTLSIPMADFDQGLDAVVTKAFDPWIKVISHDQLIQAIKASTIIGTATWYISTDVSSGSIPGWKFVMVNVNDISVEKAKHDREVLEDYQRSIGRDAPSR